MPTLKMSLRRAFEAQDAEETWTDEERGALAAHIEEGYLFAIDDRPQAGN
jgi:hypothetical protein